MLRPTLPLLRRLRTFLIGTVALAEACGGTDAPSIRMAPPATTGAAETSSRDSNTAGVPSERALRFASITAGLRFSCGLDGNGRAWCWGGNRLGQLGVGDSLDRYLPTPVKTSVRFAQLVAGETHVCGADREGQLHCWGDNHDLELGDALEDHSEIPIAVRGHPRAQSLALGAKVTCVTDRAGVVSCWGTDVHGERGDARHDSVPRAEGEPVRTDQRFASIVAGRMHVCGLTADGQAWCWGDGGLLGDGTITDRTTPVAVRSSVPFVSLTAGESVTCGLEASGAAWCWGIAFDGQLGQGEPPRPNTFVPSPVVGGIAFAQLAAGKHRVCGLDRDGGAWCWGSNYNGGLGDGTGASQPAPVRVRADRPFAQIAAGDAHTCALDRDGRAWCWGENADAQGGGALGDGTLRSRDRPTPVAAPETVGTGF
jgi:alpha-tubulin suppressor-like RCC1 family protein